jgi:hypothetical protein
MVLSGMAKGLGANVSNESLAVTRLCHRGIWTGPTDSLRRLGSASTTLEPARGLVNGNHIRAIACTVAVENFSHKLLDERELHYLSTAAGL